MNHLIFFLLGLVGLWLGAELITRGALKIAHRMGLSESFIGLTILAFGTDFPEIMVGVTGAVEKRFNGIDSSGIILGNIIGSNMGQIALVLGIVGLLNVLKFKKRQVWSHGLMLVASTLLFWVVALDGVISRSDGIIFLLFYLVYFVFLEFSNRRFNLSLKVKHLARKKIKKKKRISWQSVAQLFSGLLIIAGASHWVISHGVDLAVQMGMSQVVVGVILVGVGTSLPELVVSVNAAIKGANDLSLSNLIGSNIVDILIALGGSALITDWNVSRGIVFFDIPYLLFTVVVVVLFLITKRKLERGESILILGLYVVYVSLKIGGF